MTKEEKLIVSTYTGFLMCNWNDVHEFIADTLGRPVWTHELADDKVKEEVRLRLKPRFLAICAAREESSQPRWIPVTERLPDEIEDVLIYGEWTGVSGTKYREIWLTDLKSLLHQGYEPIAWMPLPAPPKEGQA